MVAAKFKKVSARCAIFNRLSRFSSACNPIYFLSHFDKSLPLVSSSEVLDSSSEKFPLMIEGAYTLDLRGFDD